MPNEIIVAQIFKENILLDQTFIALNLTYNRKPEINFIGQKEELSDEYNKTNNYNNSSILPENTDVDKVVTSNQIKNTKNNYLIFAIIVALTLIIFKSFLNQNSYQDLYEKIRNKRIFR